MLYIDSAYNEEPGLIIGSGRNLEHVRIQPKELRIDEVDAMLHEVSGTLASIKPELINGIESIPFLILTQW